MDKYILIKDWYNIAKGTIILNDNGEYKHTDIDGNVIIISEDTLSNETYFQKYDNDPLTIINIDNLEDDNIKHKFRIQLDVNCSKLKLKEIEKFIREHIDFILDENK